MSVNTQAPENLSREEVKREVERLRELESRIDRLESLIGTRKDISPEEAKIPDVTLAGLPAGKMIYNNRQHSKEHSNAIEDLQAARESERSPQLGGNRDAMLPIHRMYGDLRTGADQSLGTTQTRAARLYGEFVERVVNNEATKVDSSGQMYTLTSGAAKEILLGKSDEEDANLLSGVREASRSQVVSRAMRDVSRSSKFEDCECEEIDDCTHATIRFRSGRPNVLAVPKETFRDAMNEVYNEDTERD